MDESITHIRPRFKLRVETSPEVLTNNMKGLIQERQGKIKAKLIDNHIILDIVEADSHYWSPQLNFRIEEDDENIGQTILAGLIGPKPKVWTFFVFIYFSLGIVGFFISSYGVSKWMLDEYSPTLWAFPIAILCMLTAYSAGKQGEKLGAEQVEFLKQFIRDAVEDHKIIDLKANPQ